MSRAAYPKGAADAMFAPPPSTVDVLRAMYQRLRLPESFTTGGYATRADGTVCGERAEDAARWSVYGALWAACYGITKAAADRRVEVVRLLDTAAQALGYARIEVAQQAGHAVVIECIKRAGESCKAAA